MEAISKDSRAQKPCRTYLEGHPADLSHRFSRAEQQFLALVPHGTQAIPLVCRAVEPSLRPFARDAFSRGGEEAEEGLGRRRRIARRGRARVLRVGAGRGGRAEQRRLVDGRWAEQFGTKERVERLICLFCAVCGRLTRLAPGLGMSQQPRTRLRIGIHCSSFALAGRAGRGRVRRRRGTRKEGERGRKVEAVSTRNEPVQIGRQYIVVRECTSMRTGLRRPFSCSGTLLLRSRCRNCSRGRESCSGSPGGSRDLLVPRLHCSVRWSPQQPASKGPTACSLGSGQATGGAATSSRCRAVAAVATCEAT